MKVLNRVLLLSWFVCSTTILLGSSNSVVITHIVNHSASTFTIGETGLVITAEQTTNLGSNAFDLDSKDLVLLPSDKPDVKLIINESDSGISHINRLLTSCFIREDVTYQGVVRPNNVQIPARTVSTKIPKEIICRRGNNIIEIHDFSELLSGVVCSYIVDIVPTTELENRAKIIRFGDSTTTTQSPFSASGFCRKTRTSITIPTFTESGTICSETYESSNFPQAGVPFTRDYLVYFPYGYFDDPNKAYPVVFHLHGTPSDPEEAVDRVATLLDLLIADKLIVPMIAIFPNGNSPATEFMGVPLASLPAFYYNQVVVNGDSIPSYWANSNALGNMETDIIFTLLDEVDEKFQTKKHRQFRGMNGFSGGAGAHQMVLPHSDRFGSVSSNSSYGLNWSIDVAINELMDQTMLPILGDHIASVDPFDSANYLLVTELPWMYNLATALNPVPAAPYKAYLPIDPDPVISALAQIHYRWASATYRAGVYATDIKTNGLKIYFDAGALDFFYYLLLVGPFPTVLLYDAYETGESYYMSVAGSYAGYLNSSEIGYEFITYRGNHNARSILQTMSALLFHSAIFSSESILDSGRVQFIGTGNVVMEEDASMIVDDGAIVGIESSPTYTKVTDLRFELNGRAQLQIGSDGRNGGVLQIGNSYSAADMQEDPSLADQSVSFTLLLNGHDAEFQVNRRGLLGLGVGIQGQDSIPNFFVVNSLQDVSSIAINIVEGRFRHNQIIPGQDSEAAILAIGPCDLYTFTFQPINSAILGGGNLISVSDADLIHPALGTGRLNPDIGRAWTTDTDNLFGTFAGVVSQGIRDIQQKVYTTEVLDGFFSEQVSLDGFTIDDGIYVSPATSLTTFASQAHLNSLNVNVLSSKSLLRDQNKTGLPVGGATQEELYTYLKVAKYDDQQQKRAPIARNRQNETSLVYLETVEDLPDNDLIVRVPETQFPPLTEGVESSLRLGGIGIVLNEADPRELVQIYDLEENW